MAGMPSIATNITIGGKLLSSMPAAVRTARMQLLSLQQSAIRTNATLTGIGKGLMGFAGSFLAFEGVKGFMTESIKLAREEAGTRAALTSIITNQNKLKGIGVVQSQREVESIERQAKALQEVSGISKNVFIHGASTLKMYKLSTVQIQQLQPVIADLMTYQKQMGMETAGDFDAIGKAIMGFPRGLKAMGIEFSKVQLQAFQMLSVTDRARIIMAEGERQHGGAAIARGKSLGGQAAIAKLHWAETMVAIGNNMKPVQDKLTLFFGDIANIIGPPLIKFSKFVADNFDSWVVIIKRDVIPVIKRLVEQGWNYLARGIAYFQQNSKWLLPWIGEVVKAIGTWIFIVGPLLKSIALLRAALVGLSLSNPWTALALAAGVAAYYVISHWSQVKKWFMDFSEWLVGTKAFNPNAENGVMRAFKKGVVPRAQPIQKGLWGNLGDWLGGINKVLEGWDRAFNDWIDKSSPHWGEAIANWFHGLWDGLVSWLIPNVWNKMVEGVKGVGDAIHEFLIHPITTIKALWDDFLATLKPHAFYPTTPGSAIPGRVPGKGGGGGGSGQATVFNGWARQYFGNTSLPSNPPTAAGYDTWEQYPWEDVTSNYGPSGNKLKLGQGVGLGINVQKQWGVKQGDWINLGGGIGWRQLNEASSRKWGVEMFTDKRGSVPKKLQILGVSKTPPNMLLNGKGPIAPITHVPSSQPSRTSDPVKPSYRNIPGQPRNNPMNEPYNPNADDGAGAGITIHNNVTYVIQGGDHHRIEELHRRHIEKLKTDIAEADFRRQRAKFASV